MNREDDEDKNPLEDLLTDFTVPKCPRCGSRGIIFHKFFTACSSQSCQYTGTIAAHLGHQIPRVMLCRSGLLNVRNSDDIETVVLQTLNNRGIPNAKDPIASSIGVLYPKQQEVDDGDGKLGSSMGRISAKVHYVTGLSMCDQIASAEIRLTTHDFDKGDLRSMITSTMTPTQLKNTSAIFDIETQKVDEKLFRRKAASYAHIKREEDGDFTANITFTICGRPTYEYTGKYTEEGGFSGDPFTYGFSTKDLIWQAFDWSRLAINPRNEIRLAAVIQGGGTNYTYIITENMDDGTFVAEISKRPVYSQEREVITSKAEDVEDAIRRLRTSFEKSVVNAEQTDTMLDFSWIKDWNYETERMVALSEISSAPFWDSSMAHEMVHFIGYDKDELFNLIYKDHIKTLQS